MIILDWKKTQSTPTYEKWEAVTDRPFNKKTRGVITLLKIPGHPPRYGISAKLYDTKVIGLQGEEGLFKVRMDRNIDVVMYETAQRKIKEFQIEMNRRLR